MSEYDPSTDPEFKPWPLQPRPKSDEVYQPARVIVGHCPECKEVIVILNNYGVWPYVVCKCGWTGDTLAIENRVRYERQGKVLLESGILFLEQR